MKACNNVWMLSFLASKRNLAMLFFKFLNQLAKHMIVLPINATSFIVCDIVQLRNRLAPDLGIGF